MTRRRDRRRFGRGPYILGLRPNRQHWRDGFPFEVPAVAAIERLDLDTPVTLLAGDNGTGKSTIVEAIAAAIGFAAEGGELERLGERPAVPRPVLGGALEPVLAATRPRHGYYLRAESFFNVASFVDSEGIFSPDLSLYGDLPLHQQSHGQSFLALAGNRFGGEGLYILDEPEAALSVSGALAFVSMNPVPPAETFIDAAKKVETKAEFAEERSFNRGANDEATSFQEPVLSDRLPSSMPYAVMFDEDCGGDTEFCARILPPLTRTTRSLAAVGDGGRFVRAKRAGHDIFAVDPELVQETIADVVNDTN